MNKPHYSRLYASSQDADERIEFANQEWTDLLKHLSSTGVLTDQRKRIVDRLVRSRVEYEFASRKIATEGAVHESGGGNSYYNMVAAHMNKHADFCLKYEAALGLNVRDNEAAKKETPKSKAPADEFLEDRPN